MPCVRVLTLWAALLTSFAPADAATSTAEVGVAGLRLGGSLPTKARCSRAIGGETETTHQFRAAGLGPDGSDAFLVVRTECLREDCASDSERSIITLWILDSPRPDPMCQLDGSVTLATARGLRLGDPESKLVQLYGKPRRTVGKGSTRIVEYTGRLALPGIVTPPGGVHVLFAVDFKGGRVANITTVIDTDPH